MPFVIRAVAHLCLVGLVSAQDVILAFEMPLLFILLSGAVVLAILMWLVCRRSRRAGRLVLLAILLGGGAFVAVKSESPSGRYAVGGCRGPGLRALGISDESYELSRGVYYDVVDGQRRRMGSYHKKGDRWTLRSDGDGPFAEQELRFSVLGFYTILPAFGDVQGGPTSFNRRRFIPFSRPQWMPEWLE